MPQDYEAFLATKQLMDQPTGIDVPLDALHPTLFPFQAALVRWALQRGRAALFTATGTGKTAMALAWAQQVPGQVLILAPLAVTQQTIREAQRMALEPVQYVRQPEEMRARICITNYDRLEHFIGVNVQGIVADEVSIIKHFSSATRQKLITHFQQAPFRLACTATPAPNSVEEIGNYAEWLGVMTLNNMRSTFFVHDDEGWRLRGHAREAFFRWLASWSMAMRNPVDLGFDGSTFVLPPLHILPHFLAWDASRLIADGSGQLAISGTQKLHGITDRVAVRRQTLTLRAAYAAELALQAEGQVIIWVGLLEEGAAAMRLLKDTSAVEIQGSDTPEEKEQALLDFIDGRYKILVTKSSIAGFGLNLQNAHTAIFLGLNDCYDEQTEIMTKRGWLKFSEVTLEDEVATVNQETLAWEWQYPTRVVWEYYEGEMIHFLGQRNFDLLVTPNHKIFVKRDAGRYPGSHHDYALKYAAELHASYKRQAYRMLSAPKDFCAGAHDEYVHIPLLNGLRMNARTKTIPRIAASDCMQLLGWYISEGYCRPLSSNEGGRIVVSQSIGSHHREEIIALLERLGFTPNAKTKDITVYSKQLSAFLLKECGEASNNKRIPSWAKEMPRKYLAILFDALTKGDGCHKYGRMAFYRTNSAQLADDVQEISLKLGMRASVKLREYGNRLGSEKFYDVSVAHMQTEPYISEPPSIVQYQGMIGCVTVPNHTVIVRRHGIPVISGNSWEAWYQAVRRLWRYGQQHPVTTHVVLSEHERPIWDNVQRKEQEALGLIDGLIESVKDYAQDALLTHERKVLSMIIREEHAPQYHAYHGDCIEGLALLPDNSIGLTVSSPPFGNLYQYHASDRDIGNCTDETQFFAHYGYVADALLRVTMPGRLMAMHVTDIPAMQVRDGWIGLKNFSGHMVDHMVEHGWRYHGRYILDKNPQAQAIRIRAKGLAFQQLRKDAAWMRAALPDYVLLFRKPGDNAVPILPDIDNETWIEWAYPVWYSTSRDAERGIRETYTLNAAEGREANDDKHICPFALDLVERCVRLWSNKGEQVLDPNAGLFSTGFVAVQHERVAVCMELKDSYFAAGMQNLQRALRLQDQQRLFA